MKTVKTTVNSNQTSSRLELFSDEDVKFLSREKREEIAKEVGTYLVEQIALSVNELTSPISGGGFKKTLSRKYRDEKLKEGGAPVPNLQLTGEMLDSLSFKVNSKGLDIGVYGKAAKRADGHNNLSGESELPERRFLPDVDQKFKSDIQSEVDQIIEDSVAKDVQVTRSDFAFIKNKEELYAVLGEKFPFLEPEDIGNMILRNKRLTMLLGEFNLLRFLDFD